MLLSHQGVVKVADFGHARHELVGERPQYTHAVATRWYRAPELLYGARCYGKAIDLWGVGCIFAELMGASLHASQHWQCIMQVLMCTELLIANFASGSHHMSVAQPDKTLHAQAHAQKQVCKPEL